MQEDRMRKIDGIGDGLCLIEPRLDKLLGIIQDPCLGDGCPEGASCVQVTGGGNWNDSGDWDVDQRMPANLLGKKPHQGIT